ncbi:hypothetical protein HY495_02910 [Candidatus Woesearchaeota archaeon]|nr:hypothetical protein [Candidatus Woesearchaeota archaeon]
MELRDIEIGKGIIWAGLIGAAALGVYDTYAEQMPLIHDNLDRFRETIPLAARLAVAVTPEIGALVADSRHEDEEYEHTTGVLTGCPRWTPVGITGQIRDSGITALYAPFVSYISAVGLTLGTMELISRLWG